MVHVYWWLRAVLEACDGCPGLCADPLWFPSGVEHVKKGYYCRVCFFFYYNEDTAKKVHCSSKAHYDKLKVRRCWPSSTAQPSYQCVPDGAHLLNNLGKQ